MVSAPLPARGAREDADMVREHNQILVVLMGVLDLAITAAAWILSFYLRFYSGLFPLQDTPPPGLGYVQNVLVITLLLTLLVFGWVGMYKPRRIQTFALELWDVLKACALVWGLEVVITHFLHRPPTPRVSILLQTVFLLVWPMLMIGSRGAARAVLRFLRRRGRNLRTAAVVGTGRLGQKLLHVLRKERWTGYRVAYFVEDTRIGQEFLGIPVRGPVENVDQIVAAKPVDAVFVALPRERSDQVVDVLGKLSAETIDVNVVPDLLSYQFLRHRVQQVGQLPVINLTDSPQQGFRAAGKRVFDFLGASVLLVLASPLMLAIAVAVKLTSRGPVFYRQRRASLGGREFEILKFRSMVPNPGNEDSGEWSTAANDPRVTRLGRILRMLSLDELPQLFNVLRGDMSLVGPRPELPAFVHRFREQVPRYALRHHVKAGITGWAQVNGFRGRTSLHKRLQYDLDYINRWSLGFDLWILLRTVVRGFYNRGP